MSIDLNWEALTTGPDGQELANSIRDFIHSKFQTVPLPRFIKSVTVHDFDFGSIGPELELKDITDPLPDFYEEDTEDDEEDGSDGSSDSGDKDSVDEPQFSDEEQLRRQRRRQMQHEAGHGGHKRRAEERHRRSTSTGRLHRHEMQSFTGPAGATSPVAAGAATGTRGGVPGGTSNLLHHFHSHLTTAGWSGTQTPLVAMASAHLGGAGNNGNGGNGGNGGSYFEQHGHSHGNSDREAAQTTSPSHSRNPSHSSSISAGDLDRESLRLAPVSAGSGEAAFSPPYNYPSLLNHPGLREKHSVSTLAPTSAGGTSRPPTRDDKQRPPAQGFGESAAADQEDECSDGNEDLDRTLLLGQATDGPGGDPSDRSIPSARFRREARVEDVQAVFRIRYAGDVKLLLTADILLDYPMPSFVGIPVRLSITGLTFDGVGVLANTRKRVHFCFLSPEDALAAVGNDEPEGGREDCEVAIEDDRELPATPRRRPTISTVHSAASPAPSVPPPPPPPPSRTSMGGLLQEVRVESEIGQRESGKQSLKNVGKVERFVLEQVRRIFEEEFVYPSFWTFLV
ncbi:Mitochondrial distribution and morphology protein 12 [Sporothrix epigloea]|uniref:Mitochondrial distribution and morphology protein 12 n=1 Tax=Sporothrix epigloea TaxID=1892477 RepID=A0ABP0DYA3_9PEZI